ncbi:MAG: sigma 54-interacting transcriptional regulator [Planctomycetes bacterium]|nr:sigma 54-interacting transcriptional regulator [Planctomycetota bacterium]
MSDVAAALTRIEGLRRASDLLQARGTALEALAGLAPPGLERWRLLAALGRVELDAGQTQAAIAALHEAVTTGPDPGPDPGERAELLLDLGRARRRAADLDGALEALERATELFALARRPDGRRRALAARGKALYAKHDWKGARGAFRAALDQKGEEPPTWRLHHAMARAYEKDGRRNEAEAAYQRAREAGWDGVTKAGDVDRATGGGTAVTDITAAFGASANAPLVDVDDEAELSRTVSRLDKDDLVKLVSLTGAVNSAMAPEPLLELLLDRAVVWLGAERGYVVVCRPVQGEPPRLEVRAARGREGVRMGSPEDEVSRSIVLQVVQKGAPVVTADALADARLQDLASVAERSLRSVACFPMRVRSGPALGAVYVESRNRAGAFGQRETALLEGLAHHVALAFERTTRYQRLADAYQETRRALDERTGAMFGLIGRARAMRQVFRLIDKLRDHDAPVLIEGETGTGKELVARAIHQSSRRRDGPFVVESCGALSEGLLEAELFGHEKGAFTGATEARRGAFERAEGGTLFLDEVSDMPARMQALLLRTLETGEVRPLGSPSPRIVDCRVICASRDPLADLVRAGHFREDLYFRINVIRLPVPPLRERKEDLPTLAEAFLAELGRPASDLSPRALEVLLQHDWPGNIRELRHCLERSSLLAGSGQVEAKHLGIEDLGAGGGAAAAAARLRATPGLQSAGKVDYHGHVLNRRQLALLDYLRANGVATNREYVQLVSVSVPTGWRDLKDLLDKGLIRAEGQGRNTVYRLTDDAPVSKSDGS